MHITEQTQKEHPDKEDTSTAAQEWTAQLQKTDVVQGDVAN